ncbi:hypothetical protein DFJ77DRAFT_433906, partial [Powellomyces hirtus]
IIDQTVTVQGISLRFKVAAPTSELGQGNGTMGLNVLLHGDGGSPFAAFPNRFPRDNLMGVAILAPPNPNNQNLPVWGGGNGGNDRPLGPLHSAAINDLIQNELPKLVKFDATKVSFTGVSGGSLLLGGFFIPTFASTYQGNNFMLNCGSLDPVAAIQDPAAVASLRIHFQSSQREFPDLKTSITQTITSLTATYKAAGLSDAEINAKMTADATPNGGHCEMDGQGFVSGITLMVDNYGSVMLGNGAVPGIGNVNKGVVGNAVF